MRNREQVNFCLINIAHRMVLLFFDATVIKQDWRILSHSVLRCRL